MIDPVVLPSSHLIALADYGFTTVSYLNIAIRVHCDGGERSEWLPRLCVAGSGKDYRLIEWLPKNHPTNPYGFDGWQPYTTHSCGGMYETIIQALGWFEWVENQKSGA